MLSKDDVDKMVREASEHADEDRQRREEVEVRNQAEQLTYQAERTIKDLGDKVSSEDKATVENQVSSLREALKGSEIEAITAGATALAETLQRVSTAAYQAAASEAGANGSSDGAGAEGSGEGGEAAEGEPAGAVPAAPVGLRLVRGRRHGRGRVQGGLSLRVHRESVAPGRAQPGRALRFVRRVPWRLAAAAPGPRVPGPRRRLRTPTCVAPNLSPGLREDVRHCDSRHPASRRGR